MRPPQPGGWSASTAKPTPLGAGRTPRDALDHAGLGWPVRWSRLRTPAVSSIAWWPPSIPATGRRVGHFERAMQQRNRLLAEEVNDAARFQAFERSMAETGVAIAAARVSRRRTAGAIDAPPGRRPPPSLGRNSPYRAARNGRWRRGPPSMSRTITVACWRRRARARPRRGTQRSRSAPIRPDGRSRRQGDARKAVLHGRAEGLADRLDPGACRSGRQHRGGAAPLLLLDEIAAHLEPPAPGRAVRETSLLGCQAWMSGTELEAFAALGTGPKFTASRRAGSGLSD